ncbi:beta-ribofuranosylaminobenzene 5'-phosphate synthase family protein [Pontimicrobium aquaticum]|uniref:Beta-ribofuranosylaminobenzene 5'-phosphate synthase n=1 Tax=Pontimicrobium aquaticum TaxID=2565367 RepID=A0A4U0ESR8_9FLAO|nr:beta-ribofuranosylaminobenzene 5'-phosphate synthase family protein [Pontimicrobium aquaticum]TJY34835.1 beta-ribofuranosylaminobenzene 5'-phosphate synthase [Pontimicrobium aquaticum]
MKEIFIKIFPRLHLTLISMTPNGYRINGGLGFSVESPNLELTIKPSKDFQINDYRNIPFNNKESENVKNVINSIIENYKFNLNIAINIKGNCPTHYGFGTGTSIRLAAIEALFKINDYAYDRRLLISLSGRGKTSGIGIRTYFDGGFVMDLGHVKNNDEILPSNLREGIKGSSLLLKNGKTPNWEFGICIPKFINFKTQKEEEEFFKNTIPIKPESVYEILYHCTYGIVPSFLENNINVFNDACSNIQKTEWKQKERSLYGELLNKLEKDLVSFGAETVGMSSLGPTLFFISSDLKSTVKLIKKLYGNRIDVFVTKANNKGREFKCLN